MGESTKRIRENVPIQSRQAALALQDELDQWERLSDEALAEFEDGLMEAAPPDLYRHARRRW